MQVPITIIGGGIIGLTVAYELSKKYSDLDIIIIEKEEYLGEHSTARNSGVLHAGIYYPTGSLKHKFCLEGNRLWREDYANELSLDINNCGKFIVSTCDEEDEIIKKYYQNALENEVSGIEWCEPSQIKEIEGIVNVNKAFFSKTTSILDVPAALKSLEKELFNKNIPILKHNSLIELKRLDSGFFIKTDREEFESQVVINAAGNFAPDIRKMIGLNELESYWVKGHYLKLNKKFYNKSLVYPVPRPGLKGLGVHTSFGIDGIIRFGPNTSDVESYDFNFEDKTIESMYESIKKVFPSVSVEDLSEDYCGIRPKIKKDGELYTDFWIKGESELGINGYVELCGIESPGLTSAPAIARYVVNELVSKYF